MRHVFISYCHADRDFADLVDRFLRDAQLLTWMDKPALRAGDSWREEIDKAIVDAAAVVVVLSASAIKSLYVTYEWSFALGLGLRIVPVLLEAGLERVHPRLAALQAIDFSDPRSRRWHELSSVLREFSESRSEAPIVSEAAKALNNLDAAERERAVQTLKQMNNPDAIQVLAGALEHPVRDVQKQAAFALADLGDARGVPALLEAIRDGLDVKPYRIANTGTAAVPVLIGALADPHNHLRSTAAEALGQIRDNSAIPALTILLSDEESFVRATAVRALGSFGAEAPLSPIIARLRDESPWVRVRAAEALGGIGGAAAVIALDDALNDPDYDVRIRAAAAIGNTKHSSAVEPLLQCLRNDSNPQVRHNAASALGTLGDAAAVPGLIEATQFDESIVRSSAFRALVAIGGSEAVSALLGIVNDPNGRNRVDAIDALGEMKNKDAVPSLIAALIDPNQRVRYAAANSLGDIGDSTAVPALIGALKDPSEDVRRCTIGALHRMGTPEAGAALRGLREGRIAGA
jgi:HEAT repeat protein